MPDPSADAAAQLRAIRSLMERATVYRAISAPAALAAGAMALALGLWQSFAEDLSAQAYLLQWIGALVVSGVINSVLLWKSADRRGEPFVSSGMKHALKALLPPLVIGLAISVHPPLDHSMMTAGWISCYGLALLAAGSFSPASMRCLGWAFSVTGALMFFCWSQWAGGIVTLAPVFMASTFGLYHIIYGLIVLLRRVPVQASPFPAE